MIYFFIFIHFFFVRSRSNLYHRHAEEIQKIAQKRNFDLNNQQQYLEAVDEFLAETAEKGFDNSVWQRICANFRLLLRRLGLDIAYSDDELRELFRRSGNALRNQQQLTATNSENAARFAKTEGKYSIKNAISSKKGYTVEYVNENAGVALNNAKGVICEEINQVFNPNDVPDKGFKGWIAQKVREYVNSHPIKGTYDVPALNGKVSVVDSSIRSLGNHGGPDEKFNLIPVIPEMLKNAILIQTESFQNRSKSHLLASKVRYGKNNRYIAIMIIHESNGQFYYDHSLLILKEGKLGQKINAENQNGNPAKTAGSNSNSASVLNVAQNALLSSGFDVKSEKNLRFSVSPVWTGSAADYDKPSLHSVGTGEGAQVYGWGLYGSESREVAEWYANNVAKEKSGSNKFEINGEIFTPHSKPKDRIREIIWLAVIQNDIESKDELLENLKQQKRIRQNDLEHAQVQEIDFFREQLKEIENTIQFTIDSDIIFRHDYIGKRNLYRQTFWADKNENLLDWDKKIDDELFIAIENQLRKENLFIDGNSMQAHEDLKQIAKLHREGKATAEELDTAYERAEKLHALDIIGRMSSGKNVYNALVDFLGSPKAASEFLYRAGIDGITYIGDSSGVRNYVAFSDEDIRIDEHIRFSINDELADYPIDQRKLNWYKNIIGKKIRLQYNDPNELAQYLIENGVQYDHERDYRTLNAAIQQAKQEVRERSTRIRNSRENAVMAKKDKFYKILSQKYGKDFKINAGTKYDGVEFIGDWMDKHKTEKGRAKAIKAEEAAEVLSKALGEDISADLVVEHFRSLKKSGLLAEYREIRKNKRLLAELAEELAEEDRMELTKDEFLGTKNVDETPEMREYRKKYLKEQAKYRKADMDKFIQENMPELYTWVLEFLPVGGKIKPTMTFAGEEFTGDWIPREWKTYSRSKPGKKTGLKLLQYERKREGALKHSSGINSDEIAQAIASKYGGDAAAIEQQIIDLFRDLKQSDLRKMYVDSKIEEKNQLKSEIEEYNAMNAAESFRLLLEQAQMERVSLIRIQDMAKKYVQKYIPKEMQGTFIQDIVQLNKYSDKPSPAYPDGRREFELAKLLKKIHSFNAKTRIMELLDGTRKRLNSTGIPISNFGDNSNAIAKIRDIVKLQPMDVERAIIDFNERIAQAEIDIENGIENAPDPNQLRTEKSLYEMFGKLDLKTPEELGYALTELRYLIDQNKESLYFRLKNKLEENRKRNFQVMQEVDGSMSPFIPKKPKDPDKKLSDFLAKNAGLKNLLHLITGKSNKSFEDTELGKLFDELESATWRGASLDRSAMENASKKLYEFFGIKTLKQKKNFFEEINETPEHTGIFINRYTSETTSHFDPETGENIMLQTDKRGFVKGVISVAHARKVVTEYDQNNTSQENSLEIQQAFPKYSSDQAKEILKNIAGKDLKNKETGISAQINTKQYNKMVSNAAVDKSLANGYSRDNHFEAVANIEELFQNAVLLEKTGDLKNNDSNVNIYRFASPFVIDNEIADVLITVKESIDKDSKRIYSLELTEIKKLSAKGNSGNTVYYTDSINNLHQKHEKIKSFLEKNQKKSDLGIEFLRQQLNDFDLGMDKVYDLFGNADENEAWKLIIEKNGTKSKEEQNYKSLYPNQYRPKEQTNSHPPRQILDTI